ncbi:MAG: cyanophycin synthetase [Hyphomonadaceae bacterium]
MKPWRTPYPKFGNGPGLVRVQAVAARLGVDLQAFGRSGAVIVGSNGKGSTAAMTAALLQQAEGGAVGLFTSPHMLDLNERFRIGGEDISDAELGVHWRRVVDAVDAAGLAAQMGGFEFLFLVAADWFAARGCAHTVWEAGLGGRLDPTRLIEARAVALTSLDLEHTDLLGATLEAIALEKAAVAPAGASLWMGECIDATVAAPLQRWCDAHEVSLAAAPPLPWRPPLAGAHQARNGALALQLARALACVDDEKAQAGLAAVRWPGRLERLSADPLVVIDVGHTPAAIAAALEGFAAMRGEREAVLVCGASVDKDAEAMVALLAASFSTIVCAAPRHKGAPAAEIAAYALRANSAAEVSVADSVSEARQIALARARGGAIYAAGGLFLASEFKAAHLGRDPASLVFF